MLAQPVTALPGIGKVKAKVVETKLNLKTVRDVLFSYPRIYKDYSKVLSPDQAEVGAEGLYYGQLIDLHEKNLNRNRKLIQARILGNRQVLNLSWFTVSRGRGSSYQYRQLSKASQLWVYGQVKSGIYGPEINGGEFHTTEPHHLGLVPVYPLVSGITNQMRFKWISFALKYIDQINECLPPELLEKYLTRSKAIQAIHFPKSYKELEAARIRLAFEEFFLFHLTLGVTNVSAEFVEHQPDDQLVNQFFKSLPFKLTEGQKKAINDVRTDMEAPFQMRRLIQGDVGSGKTVVAQYAALKAVDGGGQVAIMVPTEILARQMYTRIEQDFTPLGIKSALLVGKTPAKQMREILADLKSKAVSVVVGTHALISEKVEFSNLTLAIVDEQHRFGVRQRYALTDKGNPDLMVMSATPIPRSLALTLYGDLNTTIMEDMPVGRKPVDTRLIHPRQRDDVYRFLVDRVKDGEQGFVVFPLVEQSDKLNLKSAIQEMDNLSKNQLAGVRVGLVHGQMGKAKDEIMQEFYDHQLDVLISTTVIEVGMNVVNATVMIIEDAERFGLAQLHQLRGRVGRSQRQAYCFLISDPPSETARERLDVLRHSNDGLEIAEKDLQIRGPGDLLGTRQSGEPWFQLANLVTDQHLLEDAAKAARKIIVADPSISGYPNLLDEIKRQQP